MTNSNQKVNSQAQEVDPSKLKVNDLKNLSAATEESERQPFTNKTLLLETVKHLPFCC